MLKGPIGDLPSVDHQAWHDSTLGACNYQTKQIGGEKQNLLASPMGEKESKLIMCATFVALHIDQLWKRLKVSGNAILTGSQESPVW